VNVALGAGNDSLSVAPPPNPADEVDLNSTATFNGGSGTDSHTVGDIVLIFGSPAPLFTHFES